LSSPTPEFCTRNVSLLHFGVFSVHFSLFPPLGGTGIRTQALAEPAPGPSARFPAAILHLGPLPAVARGWPRTAVLPAAASARPGLQAGDLQRPSRGRPGSLWARGPCRIFCVHPLGPGFVQWGISGQLGGGFEGLLNMGLCSGLPALDPKSHVRCGSEARKGGGEKPYDLIP
jgi:hypothetical protein